MKQKFWKWSGVESLGLWEKGLMKAEHMYVYVDGK